jgi:hypothetical protein
VLENEGIAELLERADVTGENVPTGCPIALHQSGGDRPCTKYGKLASAGAENRTTVMRVLQDASRAPDVDALLRGRGYGGEGDLGGQASLRSGLRLRRGKSRRPPLEAGRVVAFRRPTWMRSRWKRSAA